MIKPNIEIIQDAFFNAMAAGYVQSETTRPIIGIAGSRSITRTYGEYTILDCWLITPHSHWSEGFILITLEGNPVWSMNYGGWYRPEVIPLLKNCLSWAYTKKIFCGGRRVTTTSTTSGSYQNNWEGDFRRFSGHEYILRSNGAEAGEHRYRGGSWLENR